MANEVRAFTLQVPAGTPQAAPVTAPAVFPPRIVNAIQVMVPPGSSGLVGWRILVSNVVVIPYLSDAWIVTAAEAITWPLERYPDSGAWSLQGYNTGSEDHSVFFRFLLSYTDTAGQAPPPLISNDVLSFTGSGG